MLTEVQKKYYGGFFSMVLDPTIERRIEGDSVKFTTSLKIANADRHLLNHVNSVFPGRINPRYKDPEPGDEQSWFWKRGKANQCLDLIKEVEPYLILKKAQIQAFKHFILIRQGLTGVDQDRRLQELTAEWEVFQLSRSQTIRRIYLPQRPVMAGIFDAKVPMGIFKTTHQNGNPFEEYKAQAAITSVHLGLLKGIHRRFGGSRPREADDRPNRYQKPSYEWQLQGSGLLEFLWYIGPFSILRKPEIELTKEFLQAKQNPSTTPADLESYLTRWEQLKAA